MSTLQYGSVCSGIEAATAAWHPLGWKASFFSEIERFPRAVLEHHYPHIPLHGDFTTIEADQYGSIDLLVGGTPCQSFSIAGLRKGLDDDRGNLALEFLRLAQRKRPQWLVWENVPGVFSSWSGEPESIDSNVSLEYREWEERSDFACFLGGISELGYGYAYRTLDAQFFGVPQSRRRVFVVAYLGDWRPAVAVLFERHSLQGHPPPRRRTREDLAGTIKAGFDRRRGSGMSASQLTAHRMRGFGDYEEDELAGTLKSRDAKDAKDAADLISIHGTQDPDISIEQAHTLGRNNGQENAIAIQERAVSENPNAGPDGAGFREETAYTLEARHTPQAVAFKPSHYTRGKDGAPSEVTPPLSADADKGDQDPIIFAQNQRDEVRTMEVAGALAAEPGAKQQSYVATFKAGQGAKAAGIGYSEETTPTLTSGESGTQKSPGLVHGMAVRRLTCIECERLQGFEDNFTLIPGWSVRVPKDVDEILPYIVAAGFTLEEAQDLACTPDGLRYRALGNSMAVPVMRWIGERIQVVSEILEEAA